MTTEPRAADTPGNRGRGPGGVARNVVALGFVSLLTDASSEMIVPLLPLFVTGTLGASAASLGLIEGVAECTATVVRLGSGWVSDRSGRRKALIVSGYGVSTVAKGVLALAGSWTAVLGMRFADRLGKGLRNPPRDALLADSVPPGEVGRAFGLHRSMDTLGAVIGPLVAWALLAHAGLGVRQVFLAAVVPALLSLVVLALFVRAGAPRERSPHGLRAAVRTLDPRVWRFVVVAVVFSLGNSSLAFVLLRAGQAGLPAGALPLAYLAYNVVYAALAWPLGHLSDRVGRRPLLLAAYLVYAAAYALLAWQAGVAAALAALVMLGAHSALFEGTQRSLLADLVEPAQRATAYGVYYAAVGAALLPASAVAGWLWDHVGPAAAFGLGAACATLAALLLPILLPAPRKEAA